MSEQVADEKETSAIAKCLEGDSDAFAYIVEKYKRSAFYTALRIVGNVDDAHDLSQEAFLKAFKALGTFRRGAVFKVWFFQILRNTCISHLRKKKKKMVSVDANEAFELVDDAPSSEDKLNMAEMKETLKEALKKLTPVRREVLILREFEDMSYDQISQVLGISLEQVKSRLHYARKQLIEELKDLLK